MVAGTLTVEVPAEVTPLKGGLLAHVDPTVFTDSRLIAGIDYEPLVACGTVEDIPDWCAEPRPDKEFGSAPWTQAQNFSGYFGLRCGPFGHDTLRQKVVATLERGIGFAAEEALLAKVAAEATVQATATSVASALGEAERLAATLPGGHIYASRASVVALGSHARHDGNSGVLYTRQGTPLVNVLSTAGLTIVGTTPADGQFWLIVTGQPRLWLGETLVHEAENLAYNDWDALAERAGAVGYDCGAHAILVEAPA